MLIYGARKVEREGDIERAILKWELKINQEDNTSVVTFYSIFAFVVLLLWRIRYLKILFQEKELK